MEHIREEDKVYTGWLEGERTWRQKTAEERLLENNIKPEVANLYIALNETK
jgi:hypothetical protein